MIVVVEGISAAGKTTWCRSHAGEHLIPETFPSDRGNQPAQGLATARYWTDWNVKRWRDALAMEAARGLAVCDTDPLKLHYSWTLFQAGAGERAQWELQTQTTREAIRDRRIGFADAYLVKIIDPDTARRQSDRDKTRVRTRFNLHVRLQESLVRWYRALDAVLSGRVQRQLPHGGLSIDELRSNELRYNWEAFDAFIASLEDA